MQNKSICHYQWFICEITINLHFPGYDDRIYTSVEFISPFMLRYLEAYVRPYDCFPRRFCSVDLKFSPLSREVPEGLNILHHPRCCHNFESIKEMILRNVIYVLCFETFLKNHIV